MQKIATYTIVALAVLVGLDMLGFMLWSLSGQTPVDGFYIGRMTAEVLRAFFN